MLNVAKALIAAQGYVELGMLPEAHAELDAAEKLLPDSPALLECRMYLHMQAGQWSAAHATSQRLRQLQPQADSPYIQGAYCLHEMGRTTEAKAYLLSGPETLKAQPLYHYNLACYDATLGLDDTALAHLLQSFRLDNDLRRTAAADRDLISLRGRF